MTLHDELTALVFGGSDEAIAHARTHLQSCKECQTAFEHVTQVLSDSAQPKPPPQGVKERLLDLARESRRMMVYANRLADFFDLKPEQAQAILDRAYQAAPWKPIVGPGISCFPVKGGPKWAQHECVMLKLEPNATFPHHPHPFGERILVLAGAFRDTNGQQVSRGEDAYNGAGSGHALTALEGEACVAAVITLKGPA